MATPVYSGCVRNEITSASSAPASAVCQLNQRNVGRKLGAPVMRSTKQLKLVKKYVRM